MCERRLCSNTAVELSRLGRKVTIVGGIGNDDLGNIALRGLINAGVNVDPVIRRSDWKTGCAAIRSMEKSKSILTAGFVDPTVSARPSQNGRARMRPMLMGSRSKLMDEALRA